MADEPTCDYMVATDGTICGKKARWIVRDYDRRVRFLCGHHSRVWNNRSLGDKTRPIRGQT